MFETDLLLVFVRKFNELGLPYAVTGSIAGVVYGESRVTHDVGLVVALPGKEAGRVCSAFPLEEFYCPPEEVLVQEALRGQRGHFNLIHHRSGFRADVYLAHRDPLMRWALKERRLIELEGEMLAVAPPEYVIIKKLEFYREGSSEKHLRDIDAILRVSGDEISSPTIEEWVGVLGLAEQWARAQSVE